MVLVKFNDNYADEFDVFGFAIYNSKEDFLLELYKTWLFEYLESGNCPKLEFILQENDLDFDDFFEEATIKDLEPYLEASDTYYQEDSPREFYFGTNEEVIYESFDEFKNAFEIKDISKNEFNTIKNLFGDVYGVFPISY